MDSGAEVYGTLVSDIQTDVEVTGKVIIPKTIERPYVSRNVPVKYCNYVDLKKSVGASVVWNQMIKNYIVTQEINGLTITNNGDSISIEGTVETAFNFDYFLITPQTSHFIRGTHKYLIKPKFEIPHKLGIGGFASCVDANSVGGVTELYGTGIWQNGIYIEAKLGDTFDIQNLSLNSIDLTAMFGTTIADYVYTLETAEAGTGIAWLQSYGFFTEDYYEYTENKIESVCTNGRTSNGITYPISAVELRGMFKLDNGELTVDGDEYESDGDITRKYGIVDLGDLSWTYNEPNTQFYATISDAINTNTWNLNLVSTYEISNKTYAQMSTPHIRGMLTKQIYVINDNYTTPQDFKNGVRGIKVIYELATPDIDLTTPFNERQKVGSTEQFDDYGVITGTRDVSIPVGNETDYLQNFSGSISGTLHYIENGLAPSGYLSGSGNFIALHLDSDDWTRYTSVKVGLDPSQASGMVEILQDEEKIVVGKISNNEQVFIVESTDGTLTKTDIYSLNELVLETE